MRQFLIDGVFVVVVLSAIPMVSVALTSGVVALAQAATQIQEQSITQLVRIFTFVLVVLVAGDWASSEIVALFERSLRALELVAEEGRRGGVP